SELAKFKIEVEAGAYISPNKLTFDSFVNEWRAKYANSNLAFKTLLMYESNLQTRILPHFGHMKIDEITPLHIVDFLDKLNQQGSNKKDKTKTLSSGSIQIAHRILKNIFTRAVKWRVLKENPATAVDTPKVRYKETVPYS